MRILLVEDEPDLGKAIKQTLNQKNYIVDWVLDGITAQNYLENKWTEYTLMILDWLLPKLSGLELLQQIRSHHNPLPVLMLTAKDSMEDKVIGLDAGADDYLVKPFGMAELLARLRALQDFDHYVANVKWILFLGVPFVLLVVMVASWKLARRAMEPVYQSYRQMQQFTADVAHELRTPLAAIRATLESNLILPTLDRKDIRETLLTLKRQNQRLSHLVADLLLLCRMDHQLTLNTPTKIQKEKVCLNDLIEDLAEELATLALASEITLETNIQVSYPVYVLGNLAQLYRLVSNLVVNGIQNTPDGGKVTLGLAIKSDRALIQITDTGIGIPETELECIFDRFYRVDQSRSRSIGGSGLGLSIAKAIVQTHQGTIKVQSEIKKGSTFTVQFVKLDLE